MAPRATPGWRTTLLLAASVSLLAGCGVTADGPSVRPGTEDRGALPILPAAPDSPDSPGSLELRFTDGAAADRTLRLQDRSPDSERPRLLFTDAEGWAVELDLVEPGQPPPAQDEVLISRAFRGQWAVPGPAGRCQLTVRRLEDRSLEGSGRCTGMHWHDTLSLRALMEQVIEAEASFEVAFDLRVGPAAMSTAR